MTPEEYNNLKHDHSIRIALLEQSMKGIKDELTLINGHLGKLVGAVVLAIVMALVQFALKGGLNV